MRDFIKYILFVIPFALFSQNTIDEYLKSVENNNQSLHAGKSLMEAKIHELKSNVFPNNPEVELSILPGSESEMGKKTIFGISQSVDFPTLYLTKYKMNQLQKQRALKEYEGLRQGILIEAKTKALEYISFLIKKAEYQRRMENAQKLFDSYNAKFMKGNASVLELNKAKILFLSSKNKFEMVSQEVEDIVFDLTVLNGGMEYGLETLTYPLTELPVYETIREEMLLSCPSILLLDIDRNISDISIKINRQHWLPSFSVGYEIERETGGTYRGIATGMNVPLWKNAGSVKAANAKKAYIEALYEKEKQERIIQMKNNFSKMKKYRFMLDEYDEMLQQDVDLKLIEKALDLGQISIIEYINELSMFYDIIDLHMETQKEYYLAMARLLDYKL